MSTIGYDPVDFLFTVVEGLDVDGSDVEGADGEVGVKPGVDAGGCCIQALTHIIIMLTSNAVIVNLVCTIISPLIYGTRIDHFTIIIS